MAQSRGLRRGLKPWQVGVLLIALFGAAAAVYWGFTLAKPSSAASSSKGLTKQQQLVSAQMGTLTNQVSISGNISYPTTSTLTFGTAGIVDKLLVQEGASVKKGDSLARLDDATIASLQKSLAQANLDLANAQAALDQSKAPYTATDVAQAKAAVAAKSQALKTAEQNLANLLTPTAQALAQARAAVSNGASAVYKAQQDLETARASPAASALDSAQTAVSSAQTALDAARASQAASQNDSTIKVASAQSAYDAAATSYSNVFMTYLGISLTPAQAAQDPSSLLASLGIDLDALFPRNPTDFSTVIPADNPATPWNETVTYSWMNLRPARIYGTCVGVALPRDAVCVRSDMDAAWTPAQAAASALATAKVQADQAAASAQKAVNQAQDALAAAQQALEAVKAGPDGASVAAAELQARTDALALAQANLKVAQDNLARLTDPDKADVDAAKAQVEVAKAQLADAQQHLADVQAGADPLDVALKEAAVNTAKLALSQAQARLAAATLPAPFDGVITSIAATPGQQIGANATVMTLVDPSTVQVTGSVSEIDILNVRLGAKATVTLDALRGQTLQGSVASISPAAKSSQGVVSYPVAITVTVPGGVSLVSGLTATASVIVSQENNVLLIPSTAVYGTFDNPYVMLQSNGKLAQQPVKVGNTDGFWTVVSQGLKEGDKVAMETTSNSQSSLGGALRQFQSGGFGGAGAGSFIITGGGAGQGVPGGR